LLHKYLQKINENKETKVFSEILKSVQPDIVHCFEMQLSGLPILPVLKNNTIPLIYSSWGSDLYSYSDLGISKNEAQIFLERVNYLITDCHRDFENAINLGFKNHFLGVFPGNGGIKVDKQDILPVHQRHLILIKGYNDGVGQAVKVLKAIELLPIDLLKLYEIIVYSADNSVQDYIDKSELLKELNVVVHSRYHFIANHELLKLMGKSVLHIANSISDGMPNALLEAMAMGSFPIQSNPGQVTEEVLTHNENGLLIENPLNPDEIKKHIVFALDNNDLRQNAQDYNLNYMDKNYNRSTLQSKIEQLYISILNS